MKTYVFKRYEFKYLITVDKFKNIYNELLSYLIPDPHGNSTIQSLYFDTDNYRLIRKSLEKPVYKEKLRLRSYGLVDSNKEVFFEIKKKYKGVVYKRRIEEKESVALDFINNKCDLNNLQVSREITYFKNYYQNLKPKMLILYDRVALYEENTNLRVTFDNNIRYRVNDLNLHTNFEGKRVIDSDLVLMEIKFEKAIPMWLVRILSKYKVYKTSFSKYGKSYLDYMEVINGKNI